MTRCAAGILLLALASAPFSAATRPALHLNGPSLSRHFDAWHGEVRDFHWGLGAECRLESGRWFYGLHGHLMFNDSRGRAAGWVGAAGGFRLGRSRRLWLEPSLVAGGICKHEYRSGRFSPFALPYLAVGWNRVGLNVALVPRISGVTQPILLLQLKARVSRL